MLTRTLCLKEQKQNVTQASQEIPHPTTGWAQVGLIAEIGRDRMWSDCYERSMTTTIRLSQYTRFGRPAACCRCLFRSFLLIRKDGPALEMLGFFRTGLAACEYSASINMRSRPKLRIC